jgi:hypothetical protein
MTKTAGFEISSDQLKGELIEIKDRLDGLEALQAHIHSKDVEALVTKTVKGSATMKKLLRLCETPQTISELQSALNLNSPQAVNNYLAPLRDNGLLHHHSTVAPISYRWGPLIRRLSKAVRDRLLK